MNNGQSLHAGVWSERNFNFVLALAVLLILAIPVGIANMYLGYVVGESPCIFCGHERFGMVLAGVLGIFILRYGPRYKYLVTAFLVGFFYMWTGFRHLTNRIRDDIGQGFGDSLFGFHTYTWAMFVYWCVIAAAAIGLIFVGRNRTLSEEFSGAVARVKSFSTFAKIVVGASFVIVVTNCVQFLFTNGVPPFAGAARPARFTLDIAKASEYWDLHHNWEAVPNLTFQLFKAPLPHMPGVSEAGDTRFSSDPASGPIAALQGTLQVKGKTEIGFPVTGLYGKGNAAGIAYDPVTDVFGLTSSHGGLYYVAGDFRKPLSMAILDVPNGDDIHYTTDATFFGPGKLVATAWNKTIYGTDRVGKDKADPKSVWLEFRESTDDLMPLFGPKVRPSLQTARARTAFTLSIAKDPNSPLFYVVSVPHPKSDRIVVSGFGPDRLLAREGVLRAGKDVVLKDGAKITGYYPVGAEIKDGKLYLLSKAFNTLLVVNLASLEVVSAYGLPPIGDANDLAIKGDSLFILSRESGKDVVYEVGMPQ